MIRSITLLGSSSGRNAGDAALVSAIMDSLDKVLGEKLLYEIPTIKPDFVKREYAHNVRALSILPWNLSVKMLGLPTYRSVLRTDLSLIFDAVLFDRALYNPLFNFLSSFYLMLPAAKKRGKRLGCYNCGLGPVTTKTGRKMLRELLENMDFITVRDEGSFRLLEELGVENPNRLLTADAALNAPSSPDDRVQQIIRSAGLNPGDEILGININSYIDTWAGTGRQSIGKEKFLAIYSESLNRVAEKLQVPLLLIATQHNDISITRELLSRVRSKAPVAMLDNRSLTHVDVKGVMRSLALLFAMRLHAAILASSELTPIAGLAYQPKVAFYFEMLGLKSQCHSFNDFNVQYLTDAILQGWEERKKIGQTLAAEIPLLQHKAYNGALLVAALHRGEDIGRTIAGLQDKSARSAEPVSQRSVSGLG